MEQTHKQTIGRRTLVDFPELGLKSVLAKIDTGSYRGAMHCDDIKEETLGGKTVLTFLPIVKHNNHNGFSTKRASAADYTKTSITSASGHKELRYIIKTPIVVKGTQVDIEITLANRTVLRYPVLIGRKFLRGRFVVDVESSLD